MIVPSIRADSIPSWLTRYRECATWLSPGIGPQIVGDCILWRSKQGRLVGILSRDLHNGFLVHVAPSHRRQGIASRLLDEALNHWPLAIAEERYTEAGAAWINSWLRNHQSQVNRLCSPVAK